LQCQGLDLDLYQWQASALPLNYSPSQWYSKPLILCFTHFLLINYTVFSLRKVSYLSEEESLFSCQFSRAQYFSLLKMNVNLNKRKCFQHIQKKCETFSRRKRSSASLIKQASLICRARLANLLYIVKYKNTTF
jgi:hypothetical protein